MQKQKIWTAEDIIGLVPDELLDNLAAETGVDYSVKKLHGKSIFKLFLFAFLNGGGLSLRILEAVFKSERFKTLFNLPAAAIKHSALGMRLKNIDCGYFEKIFEYLIRSPRLETVLFDRKKVAASKFDTAMVEHPTRVKNFLLINTPGIKTWRL